MDIKEMWEADRLRTERVRAIPAGEALDEALAVALGSVSVFWWGASNVRSICVSALEYFQKHHPDRVEAFADRFVDEIDPNCGGVYNGAIECGTGGASGHELVVRILTAEPAAIVRAIILALPERTT